MHRGRISSEGRHLVWLAAAVVAVGCVEAPMGPGDAPGIRRPSYDAASLAAFTGNIRIGVIPDAASVQVGGTVGFVARDKVTGGTLLLGGNMPATVTLQTDAVTNHRLQAICASPSTRDARLAAAQARGIPTYTEHIVTETVDCWRVYLGEFPLTASFTLRNNFRLEMIALGLADPDAFYRQITFGGGDDRYTIKLGTASATSRNPIVVEPVDGMVTIGGRRYRGVAEVRRNGGSALAGVNELPMEEYLYGVVPCELPPNPYGEIEAQKAQAVSARTYALANLGKQAARGFDLLPTTADQVYCGFEDEDPISTAAIDATAGMVATYEGTPFTTFYHSTSGGFTANSEDVFTTALPYLRGVPDAERGHALEHVPSLDVFKRHGNPTNLRAQAEGDFESDWSRYHRWVVEWTREEMAGILAASFNTTVTDVTAITVTERSDHGRVLRIAFTTPEGELEALKDNIRSRLRYHEANGAVASLRSTLFWIEPVVNPKTKVVTGWKAYGGGWGHGVGMSQTGAVGMAQRGYDFERILKHYYQGIELVRWY